MTDVSHAKEIIRSTSLLELKLVEQGPVSAQEQLMTNGAVPPDTEILPGAPSGRAAEGGTVYYLVHRVPVVSGRDLRTAKPSLEAIRNGSRGALEDDVLLLQQRAGHADLGGPKHSASAASTNALEVIQQLYPPNRC